MNGYKTSVNSVFNAAKFVFGSCNEVLIVVSAFVSSYELVLHFHLLE